jgi:hypothetical protein
MNGVERIQLFNILFTFLLYVYTCSRISKLLLIFFQFSNLTRQYCNAINIIIYHYFLHSTTIYDYHQVIILLHYTLIVTEVLRSLKLK